MKRKEKQNSKTKNTNSNISVLFVLENYYPHIGGVERVFKNLVEGLAKKGNKVIILTHKLKGTKEYEKRDSIEIYRIGCLGTRYLFTFLSLIKTLKLSKNVDIIHTTTYNGAPPAWVASKINNKPCVITVHEVLGENWLRLMNPIDAIIHRILEYVILKLKYNKYIAVSDSTKTQLNKINIKNVSRIYNGVDYNFWTPKRSNKTEIEDIKNKLEIKDNFVCVFFGRPGISKGLEYLVRSIPYIKEKVSKFKLLALVSKDKAYKKRYEYILKLSKKLGVYENIIFHESVPDSDLINYIMVGDIVVAPSLSEGFGFSVAEGCALNKPVVASNVDSIPEVISRRFCLVRKKDPKSIAEGIVKVFNRQYTKRPFRKFKLSDNVENHLNLYNKLLLKPK